MANVYRKREREEEVDVSSLTCESPSKNERGVVMQVSPTIEGKMGNTYFSGRISDGVASMQLVGLDSKVGRRILDYVGKSTAVTMSKCQVKKGRHDD